MLQAAEDVLNLLSQEGVYVDELAMEPVDPVAWRRFMAGRPRAGGRRRRRHRDPGPSSRARPDAASDSIFRDSALFFQRRFDGVLAEFAADAERRRARSSSSAPARAAPSCCSFA